MLNRVQIARSHMLEKLNNDEVMQGYKSGMLGEGQPDMSFSYSYWHGWTKGTLDQRMRPTTIRDVELESSVVRERNANSKKAMLI